MTKASLVEQIISFLKACEKLKTITRKSWTSDNSRRESVAEHSWMMCLLALTLFDQLDTKIDQLKVLKMIIIHDLVEVFAGDIAVWEKTESPEFYFEQEKESLIKLLSYLPQDLPFVKEVYDLWIEFEKTETIEAKLAKAIDKLEVLLQYNIFDINKWEEPSYQYLLREGFYDFDSFIREFKNQIDKKTFEKVSLESKTNLLNQNDLLNFYGRQKPTKPKISAIAAISKNRVIGKDGKLPWHIPSDLKRMRQITLNHPIIMGRKTFESIGRPLPKRTNIVITTQPNYQAEGIIVVHSLEEAIKEAEKVETQEIFIFGGGEIYKMAMPIVQKLYLTVVDSDIQGDTYFPEYYEFSKVVYEAEMTENGYTFKFLDLEREN